MFVHFFTKVKKVKTVKKRKKLKKTPNQDFIFKKDQALLLIKNRLNYYLNYYYKDLNNQDDYFYFRKITIKDTKTRWGSCSSNKNLNFNYRVIYLPIEVLDYIVVHELCHLKEMNHKKAFWDMVFLFLPDYKDRHLKLKTINMNNLPLQNQSNL